MFQYNKRNMNFGHISKLFVPLLLIPLASIHGQTIPSAEICLSRSDSYFSEKAYNKAITEAQRGIDLYENCPKDSIYVELLRNQFCSYSYINNSKESIKICREAISIYESFGRKDNLLYSLYRSLSILTYDYEEKHKYILEVLKSNYFRYSDYSIYGNSFVRHNVIWESDYPEILDLILKDEEIINSLSKRYLDAYYLYIKAKYSPITTAIPLLLEAISIAQKYNKEEARDSFLYDFYACLSSKYEDEGFYSSSALYKRKMLELSSEYWEKWRLHNPWMDRRYKGDLMYGFTSYIESLNSIKEYESIIEYCNIVLGDQRFNVLLPSYRPYLLTVLAEAYENIGRHDEALNVSNTIAIKDEELGDKYYRQACSLYHEGKYEEAVRTAELAIKHGWSNDSESYNNLYQILINCGHEDVVKQSTLATIKYYLSLDLDLGSDWDILYSDDDINNRVTPEDRYLGGLRELFKHANGCSSLWQAYYYYAESVFSQGNYKEAINYQSKCLDLVRTDWWVDPNEREEILCDPKSIAIDRYIYPEIRVLYKLASYYAADGNYPESYR